MAGGFDRRWILGGPVPGTFEVVGGTVTFTPSTNLPNNRVVSIKITPALRGTNNQRLASDYNFSFTTIPAGMEVIETIPYQHETEVAVSTTITMDFSKDIDATTVSASTIIVIDADTSNPIAGTFDVDGTSVVFTPTTALDYNQSIQVTIKSGDDGVRGTDGERLSSDYVFDFLTIGAFMTIEDTVPEDEAVDVAINTTIVVDFSVDIDEATVDASTFQVSVADAEE
jgi:hypothetical protein